MERRKREQADAEFKLKSQAASAQLKMNAQNHEAMYLAQHGVSAGNGGFYNPSSQQNSGKYANDGFFSPSDDFDLTEV